MSGRALLLPDSPAALREACRAAGLAPEIAPTLAEARARVAAAREPYDVVDGRVARPRPLDEELRHRLDAFFDRLRGHRAGGLYDAVMREVERPLIAGALERAKGVRQQAAATLGIDRGTLARRMRALGLDDT